MGTSSKKEIIFIQPGYAHYRDKLFSILSKRHDIYFIYEHSNNTYPGRGKPAGSCTFIDQKYKMNYIGLIYAILKNHPEIIISSTSASYRSLVSYLYAILFRKRFILWILEWQKRQYASRKFRRLWRRLRNLIGIKLIHSSHALVVGGSAALQYALSLRKDKSHIFMAMQCTDDLMLKQNVKYIKKKLQQNKYTFLYLSRIISRKGLDVLLKAFFKLRSKRSDVFLLIGGDGPFKPYCQELAQSLEMPDVQFLGSVHPDFVVAIYNQSDVFVLPSYHWNNRYEPWGLVINEAASMGLPIITTTAVGAAYDLVIEGYNGFVVKDNNVDDLYKAMEKILDMDLVCMGKNSRSIFERKNDFYQMANGFTSAIKNVNIGR